MIETPKANLCRIMQHNNKEMTYLYDTRGNFVKLIDSSGNLVELVYDSVGHKIETLTQTKAPENTSSTDLVS